MKVILTETVESIGQIGDVVNVAPGYARNFLLPKGLAMEATGKNVRELEHKKRLLAQKREKQRQEMLSYCREAEFASQFPCAAKFPKIINSMAR